MFPLLAQTVPDAFPSLGSAGTIGGLSLLAGVLAWLMFKQFPALLQHHKDELASKDALVTKLVDNFREEMKQEREVAGRFGDLLLANTSETRLLSAAVTNLAQQAGLVLPPKPTK